jgi:hypothetical protein
LQFLLKKGILSSEGDDAKLKTRKEGYRKDKISRKRDQKEWIKKGK